MRQVISIDAERAPDLQPGEALRWVVRVREDGIIPLDVSRYVAASALCALGCRCGLGA